MTDSDKSGATELKELMTRVFASDASDSFGQFMVRQIALNHMAPNADHALLEGIDESPDGGAAMAGNETGRRLHAAASALLAAVDAGRLPVAVTPEMVAVAAMTELGD